MSQIEIKDERDAYEYLEQCWPNDIVTALDMAQLTIESDEEQIIEAECDVMIFALQQDATKLLRVREALQKIIKEVRSDIKENAEDAAWECYNNDMPIADQRRWAEQSIGRPLNDEERKLWDDRFAEQLEYHKREVLVETEHGTMTLTHSFEETLSLPDGWPGGEA